MSYPVLIKKETVQKSSALVGKELGFYDELFKRLVADLPDYVTILEHIGKIVSELPLNLKWSKEVAMIIHECHPAAKYIIERYILDYLGCDRKKDVSEGVYQSAIANLYVKVRRFAEYATIQIDGITTNYIQPPYPNVYHYLHSGVLQLNEADGSVIIAEDPEGVLREYCTLYIETKDEADFILKYLRGRELLNTIASAKDELTTLSEEMRKALPNKKIGDDFDFDFLSRFLHFDGANIRYYLGRNAFSGGLDYDVILKIIYNFIPVRKKVTPKCYDKEPDIDDPFVFAYTGYKNPDPGIYEKERWPELYGKTEWEKFKEELEEELKSYPSYQRNAVRVQREMDYYCQMQHEAQVKYKHSHPDYK